MLVQVWCVEALVKAYVLRDRVKMVVGTPVCKVVGHDWSRLHYVEGPGYYQVCQRCGAGDLLAHVSTG